MISGSRMRAICTPGSAYEESNRADFGEYDNGVVLINDEGHDTGYIPHGISSHIERHSEEEVRFKEEETPEGDEGEQ